MHHRQRGVLFLVAQMAFTHKTQLICGPLHKKSLQWVHHQILKNLISEPIGILQQSHSNQCLIIWDFGKCWCPMKHHLKGRFVINMLQAWGTSDTMVWSGFHQLCSAAGKGKKKNSVQCEKSKLITDLLSEVNDWDITAVLINNMWYYPQLCATVMCDDSCCGAGGETWQMQHSWWKRSHCLIQWQDLMTGGASTNINMQTGSVHLFVSLNRSGNEACVDHSTVTDFMK